MRREKQAPSSGCEGPASLHFFGPMGEYCDLVKDMVIDPKKVTRCALENAVSVTSMFLTCEVACIELPKKDAQPEQM